ncbi:glycosyltransferase family 4 protein [Enteractinococcus helveticum]|uniref:Glycosyltransferase subfamily 4-like N-terminal domain-containing protein n=1 Tax=Enteractinococcus helveticum TaxID=1837282 RepID=A0A1B7LV49_9MICC|nr:glycosyltransferase family 4 protein [Enteractinococcus helveticum]OAV51901.1 hypothetical protein A6F49_01515 [Enteractinococcus helveticum]
MKKVVLIVTVEDSALTFYRNYVRFLVGRGWEVSVIGHSSGALEAWAASEGATGYHIPYERDPSMGKDLQTLWATVRLLRRIRPDVVVSATPKVGLLGTLAARLVGVPVRIYQLWGMPLETVTGLKRKILDVAERTSIRSATQTVANSFSLARTAEALELAPQGHIDVLGVGSSHGVNLEWFDRAATGPVDADTAAFLAADCDLTIVFIGRLTPDKGISTLLQAVDSARAGGLNIRLVLVGPVENRQLAEEVSDVEHIHRLDNVEDVRPYITAADVLCLPTLREGFPNVVLEAAALEVPAVVTDATGAIDSVVDGETGWIFPVENPHALAEVITEIVAHPEQIQQRGTKARRRVEEHFEQVYMFGLQEDNIAQQLEPHLARQPSNR